ncbi:flagellar hook-associated protein FlgK [Halomonas campisalis]|uniref:Flagellar hook-associated protein 1 n=1 Tax=Billgrantia campisalis TaxID=74661 RepID=A0ABS9P399_9GAMM|nr:flagellar hook-associated protein FlgK [Halomonas campisalis]MCG6656258.1 flagellar hook-associated protein FlgK [Halomonas campisalis]MDR5861445.1 flagellar hook-associated protein FlgK [Halomonas campisalis]
MSMFSIGLSGLNAAQNALNTTSNNISNVYTPGYNREIAVLGEGRGDGGVRVNDIQRQFNHYVASQLNAATSSSSALKTYENQISQIDNLLADREAGLAPLMQNFFSSLEDLAGAPSDPAARQGVLGTADTMTAQFRAFDGYLQDLQNGINGQIADEVQQINNTTEQLAGLNREIALARARHGEAPNGLLNQRDQLVHELSERMDVRLNIQDGKTYNISLPNGQPLVAGTNAYRLEAMQSPTDPQRTVIGYREGTSGNGNVTALDESTIKGGTLGGLMSFRSETLDKTQNQIGQLAVSLASSFNQQHQLGVDLDGEQGQAMFSLGEPVTYFNERNTGTASVDSTQFDPATLDQLQATDYEIRVNSAPPADETAFTITRKDTGREYQGKVELADNTLTFGGISLTFDDLGNLANNDRFEVQPVRRAAAGMSSEISDLDKIAAGSFVASSGDLSVSGLRAEAGALSSLDPSDALAQHTFTLETTGGQTFVSTPDPSEFTVNGQAYAAGDEINVGDTINLDGIEFVVNAMPGDGETASVSLSFAVSGTGDNRNALAMQDLQSVQTVGGRSTLSQFYGAMVSDVGNRTNIVQVNLEARQGLTDQLKAVQQSESGVNLDEEAANLIRYQQFYAANARVIDTASTIFDTILGLRN